MIPEHSSCCLISILTPPGRGAVASIGVRGEGATSLVSQLFRPASGRPLDTHPLGRIVFGRWQAAGGPGEELVVCRRDVSLIEIHCHGGPTASTTIAADLVARGARLVSWEEWCAAEEEDLLTAEARIALAAVRTPRGAAMLLDQYRGALRHAAQRIEASVEASELAIAKREIDTLLQAARVGLHAATPWQVVLAGRPNVGKSSLLNALAGFQRAIVSAEAGTTRDVVTATVVLDGWRIALSDTAGHRATTDDPLEAAGMTLARDQWLAADLILLVADASQPWSDVDELLYATVPSALIVHNKQDLGGPADDGRPSGIAVSARTGVGIERLSSAIVQRLVPDPPAPGQAVPFTPRQVDELRAALDAIKQKNPQVAIDAIRRFIGGRQAG